MFTFTLIPATGAWTFTLIDQLDHAAGNNENDLLINLGAIVQATDRDGDTVIGNATGLVITVDDDTPTAILPDHAVVTNTGAGAVLPFELDQDGTLSNNYGADRGRYRSVSDVA